MQREMTPKMLDTIVNGATVYIYRRPSDGAVYPSLQDYSRFGVEALETVRVKFTPESTAESVLADHKVAAAVRKHAGEFLSTCPCGVGDEPCPRPDGKPACAD